MSRPSPLLVLLLAAAVAAGCGGSENERNSSAKAPGTGAAAPSDSGCRRVPAPRPRDEPALRRPRDSLDPDRSWVATVKTNCGDFEIELAVDRAPTTSESFAYLVRKGFFDGVIFHRIADGFVIQGGDPRGDGTGGPGYKVREAPPGDIRYSRGVVAMAKAGGEPRGTSGSQFFVVTGEDTGLPSDYALLGRVVRGMETVDRIAAVPHDASTGPGDGRPSEPVVIEKVTLASS
jgi:peptidyl-prolyl cis-trans isomerase B (cyclophilin B)